VWGEGRGRGREGVRGGVGDSERAVKGPEDEGRGLVQGRDEGQHGDEHEGGEELEEGGGHEDVRQDGDGQQVEEARRDHRPRGHPVHLHLVQHVPCTPTPTHTHAHTDTGAAHPRQHLSTMGQGKAPCWVLREGERLAGAREEGGGTEQCSSLSKMVNGWSTGGQGMVNGWSTDGQGQGAGAIWEGLRPYHCTYR